MIVRQVRHGSDDLDTFAATAITCGARTLLALLAEKNHEGGGRWMASFGDVKTALLHAPLPSRRK
eukprot:16430250-Heterocapsa_arctica.AAC.1